MNSFTDADGRCWQLSLSVGLLRTVRERTGVEIGKAIGGEAKLAELVFGDPEPFARVLWVLVERQAQAAGVEPEAFAAALDGRTVEAAAVAMLGAVADFFPRSRISAAIKRRLPEMLERMDGAMEKATDQAVDQALARISMLSTNAGDSPASSASTPAP